MQAIRAIAFGFVFFISSLHGQSPVFEKLLPENNTPFFCYDITYFNNTVFLASDKGVFTIKNRKIEAFYPSEYEILSFTNQDSILLFNDFAGNFFVLQHRQVTPLKLPTGFKNFIQNTIVNSFTYYQDTLYIGTVLGENAFKVFDNGVVEIFSQPGTFSYLYQLPQTFFYGNYGKKSSAYVHIINPGHTDRIPFSIQTGMTKLVVFPLSENRFLIAKGQEIMHIHHGKIVTQNFLGKSIECIFMDNENKLWIGTAGGGLICFPSGNINSENSINYLGNKTVSGICQDAAGNLWVATVSSGIFKFNQSPDLAYSGNVLYSADSTPQSTGIKTKLPVLPSPNNLLINDSALRQTPPYCTVTALTVNNRDTVVHNYYQLPSKSNSIIIELGGMPLKNGPFKYKYRLKGFDSTWIYSGNNKIHYALLPKGHYVFQAQCMDKFGKWSMNTAAITFDILPPFYETTTFWLSAITIILFIGGILVYLYFRRKQQLEQSRFEQQKRLIESEMMALRTQMNPHFIFNTLSSIQNFIVEKNSKDAEYYLTVFAKLLRKVLENSKHQQVTIAQEVESLTLYLQLEQVRFNYRFEYCIDIDATLDPKYDAIPPMLIQPVVENALWHGIRHLPKEKKGKITIRFAVEHQFLTCTITDNGVGRTKANALKSKSEHNSLATQNIEHRLKLLSTLHKKQYTFEIIDLHTENIPSGTQVIIKIPYEND